MEEQVKIIEYKHEHQPAFERLNREWIEKFFEMEKPDFEILQNPEQHILRGGGAIFMALTGNEIVGTVAMKQHSASVFEMTKMAVEGRYQGRKVGRALATTAIEWARDKGAEKIILYSNTKLLPAIWLYEGLGFREIPVDGPYKRSDIKMELLFSEPPMNLTLMNEGISVRTCNLKDIDVLVALGIKTFRDTFDEFNDPENMIRYINDTFTRKIIEHEMKEPGTVYFLALDGRKPVGYAKMRTSHTPPQLENGRAIELERLYVHRDYLGKRVGRLLMQTCLSHAEKKNAATVWLGVWEHNARAIAFYEKYGFSRFGQHTFLLGGDEQTDWLMKKDLA